MTRRKGKAEPLQPGLPPTSLITRAMSCGHVIVARSREAVEAAMADHLEHAHKEQAH